MASSPALRNSFRTLCLVFAASACSKAKSADPHPPIPPTATTSPVSALTTSFEREARGRSLRLSFHADPLPNLVYQLDCMAGTQPCSRAAYEALWRDDLGWSDDDQHALDAFREARERWGGTLELHTSTPSPSPLPLPRADRTIAARLSIAGLVARTPEEHVRYLGLLTPKADAARLQSLIDHFRPRFDRYWQREGRALCESSAEELAALFEREHLDEHVERLAAFYRADLPQDEPLDFHLMARPAHRSVDAARQIGGHAIVEMPKDETPARRAPIVVHEILHHLHAAAPDQDLAALARSFVETKDPLAGPAYAVLDEALATALGTEKTLARLDPIGLSQKLHAPQGLYAEPIIDRVAKAALPFLDARLAEGRGLHDPGFARGFLDAVHEAYPQGMPPIAHARPLVAALEPAFWPAFQALDGASLASSLGGARASDALRSPKTVDLFDSHLHWGGAFFVTHHGVAELARYEAALGPDALEAIENEARHTPAFLYSTQRSPGVYRFVFVADDVPTMSALVRALAAQRAPFEGVLEIVPPKIRPGHTP